MVDIVLTIVIALLICLVAYLEWEHRQDKQKLINALLAKRPEDMVNMTLADQTKVVASKPVSDPLSDLKDMNDLSQEEFENFVDPPKNG